MGPLFNPAMSFSTRRKSQCDVPKRLVIHSKKQRASQSHCVSLLEPREVYLFLDCKRCLRDTGLSTTLSVSLSFYLCDRILCFIGAIELALRTASDLDPHKKAIDFVRDGEHPADPRKALFEARKECYAEVIKALKVADDRLDKAVAEGDAATATQSRNEAYALAIASDDELFHFYLYDWHVERGLQEQLLEVRLHVIFFLSYVKPYSLHEPLV